MGQSQSQPSSTARDPESSSAPAPSPVSPQSPMSPMSMDSRRKRTLSTAAAGARRRLSTLIRTKQRSEGDELIIGESSPRTQQFATSEIAGDMPAASGSVSPTSEERSETLVPVVKNDSLRKRIFKRKTVAIPPPLNSHDPPPPGSPTFESPLPNGYAHPGLGDVPESSTAGSHPFRLPSESISQTPIASSSGQSPSISHFPEPSSSTRRDIAMLSGTSAVTPAPQQATIDEDPAGTGPIPLTRTASWRSLVHQPSVENHAEMLELEIPQAEESVPMEWIPQPQPQPRPAPETGLHPVPSLTQVPTGPLPVVPMGTTMIIQGVVQAAEDAIRPRRDAAVAPTTTENVSLQPDSERTNAHAHLSGTFPTSEANSSAEPAVGADSGNAEASGSARVTSPETTEGDSPSGAAELLSALLIAAASATANMLLTDYPSQGPTPSGLPSLDTSRSSVGVGPRPPRINTNGLYDDGARRRSSLISALRERFARGPLPPDAVPTPDEDTIARILRNLNQAPPADPVTDAQNAIESLRERIANELMRALAARDGTTPAVQEQRRPSLPFPISQARSYNVHGSPAPAEGTFDRFLYDTNVELRATLMERMTMRERLMADRLVPIPAASQEGDASVVVHRPPEGVIEPRLNWWRLHRFPARTVAALPPAPGTTDQLLQRVGSPQPEPNVPIPGPSTAGASSSTTSPAAPGADPSTTPASTTLIPVIVVGIRTAPAAMLQEIGHMTNDGLPQAVSEADRETPAYTPRSPTSWNRALNRFRRNVLRRRPGDQSTDSFPVDEEEEDEEEPPYVPASPPFSPAVESRATGTGAGAGPATEEGRPTSPDRTRNYLIWVIGGYYPENHPILTSPNVLLNQFDQDDLWGLAELLGQVKPPVASKDDIAKAGLEIIKAEDVMRHVDDGKVSSNTCERCLICLGDYESGEDVRIMTCKHAFHQECVDRWLEVGRNNCPACRTKGVDVPDASPMAATVPTDPSQASSSHIA